MMKQLIPTLDRICEAAKRNSYGINLASESPGESGDGFAVSYNVGGIVTLLIEQELYADHATELQKRVRSELERTTIDNYLLKIRFYPK